MEFRRTKLPRRLRPITLVPLRQHADSTNNRSPRPRRGDVLRRAGAALVVDNTLQELAFHIPTEQPSGIMAPKHLLNPHRHAMQRDEPIRIPRQRGRRVRAHNQLPNIVYLLALQARMQHAAKRRLKTIAHLRSRNKIARAGGEPLAGSKLVALPDDLILVKVQHAWRFSGAFSQPSHRRLASVR
jgi:hypothetical protein